MCLTFEKLFTYSIPFEKPENQELRRCLSIPAFVVVVIVFLVNLKKRVILAPAQLTVKADGSPPSQPGRITALQILVKDYKLKLTAIQY